MAKPITRTSFRSSFLAVVSLSAMAATLSSTSDASAMIAEETAIEGGGGGGYSGSTTTTTTTTTGPGGMCVYGETCFSRPGAAGSLITVYLHGRCGHTGGDNGVEYWRNGDESVSDSAYGPSPVALRWHCMESLSASTSKMLVQLDALCYGADKPCQVVCHSTGCLLMGRLASETGRRWNITTVYALAGAQGGTPGADTMIDIYNGAPSWGARIGAKFGGVWGGVVGWFAGKLSQMFMRHFEVGPFPVSGVIYDLRVNVARSMYYHDTSYATQTITADNRFPRKRCRWYQVGCHLNNVGRGLSNALNRQIMHGGNDGVIPVSSSASFRMVIDQLNVCPLTGGKWTNHTTKQPCSSNGLSVPSIAIFQASDAHMEVKGQVKVANIYSPPGPEYDDCSDEETEGTCNSYDDYLDAPLPGGDGMAINERCGGYDLGTQNYYYGYDCSTLRYTGTTGGSTNYNDSVQVAAY